MRVAPNDHIYDLWNEGSGQFFGSDGAPHGRVTVEIGWELRKSTATTFGSYDRGPLRWFQRSNNSQTETEVQNVRGIDIDRSIDVDAATCKITMTNMRMLDNGQIISGTTGEGFGQPGYFWPGHGDSAFATERWGFVPNSWNDVLQPNALLRTYQGYGGRGKEIDEAIADGNIIQTGIWLVDDVNLDAKTGIMVISCRDMAKLLIEQTLYPPLVPVGEDQSVHYPLNYYRWIYVNHPVIPYGDTIYKTGFETTEGVLSSPNASSHFDNGTTIHPGSDAIDGEDPSSFWMSSGRANPAGGTDFEYLEFNLSGSADIAGLNIQPYAGNYEMYVSVKVGGVWQPHPTSPGAVVPFSTGFPRSAEFRIPYVTKVGVGWERAATIDLGQLYQSAGMIRVTFTHLAKVGPTNGLPCVAGVRDFQVGTFSSTITGGGRIITGIARGHNNSTNGYWLVGSDGGVFTFGKLKFYGSEGSKAINAPLIGIASKPDTGKGYRLAGSDGGVYCFGDAYYQGSLPGQGIVVTNVVGIENGDQGSSGYYLIRDTGEVYAFGSAVHHGNHSGGSVSGMAVKANGYWTVNIAGAVQAHGSATNYGSVASPDGFITAIEGTSTGLGYWCVSATGAVYSFGDAVYHGGANSLQLGGGITDMVRTHTDSGYWLVGEDGGVFAFGDAMFSGSLPEQFSRVGNGNYDDYVDIIKDLLLWSGWWFRNPTLGDSTPANVFGSLESTGIFAPDNLTEDFFDKKPVIDVINTFKEIVGYITFADEIGAYHFKTPNVWTIGNFLETGPSTALMPVITDEKQLIGYTVDMNDTDARSQIIIATDDPALDLSDTKSVTINSQWGGDLLRGIVRPAMWVNGQFLTEAIQRTMAQLIDLHLFMQQRIGTVTMPANPILQIDDQVRIFERTTSETYIHYIRGYSTHMDLEGGEFTQTLQTHWMGDGDAWFLDY